MDPNVHTLSSDILEVDGVRPKVAVKSKFYRDKQIKKIEPFNQAKKNFFLNC